MSSRALAFRTVLVFASAALAGCSGSSVSSPGVPGSGLESQAVREQSSLSQRGSITVDPTQIRFAAAKPQTVAVSVIGATVVYATSRDARIATVSPSRQRVPAPAGGTVRFTIAPRATRPSETSVCFVTGERAFVCVGVHIGDMSGKPVPSPTPTPTPSAAPTVPPTPRPVPTATPSPVRPTPVPSPTSTPSPTPTPISTPTAPGATPAPTPIATPLPVPTETPHGRTQLDF
jgi:hypothetical protein